MFLATTAIKEFWEIEDAPLLLGPWCLGGEKNAELHKNRHYTMVPTPWKPAAEIKKAADYCHGVYERLFSPLSKNLNSIHQVSYPERYWRILVGPWLLHFISVFYDRYKRIENALEKFPGLYTAVLPKHQCKPFSYDTADFLSFRASKEDYYNLQLFSIIAYELCPHNVLVKEYKHEAKIHTNSPGYSWKAKFFNKLMGISDLFFKNSVILCDMRHFDFRDMILLKKKGMFKTFRFINFEPTKQNFREKDYVNYDRSAMGLEDPGDKFQTLLYKILPDAIPACYIEDYNTYRNSVKDTRDINSVRIVGSSMGWLFNEKFKFFAAEAATKGAKLVDFQHGGGYGLLLATPSEELSLEKDIFYTWGWDLKENNRAKPLPSSQLSKLKNTHSPRRDNLLFVGMDMPEYQYRFHTLSLPEDMPKYFRDKKIFFETLSEEIKNKVLYRPHMSYHGIKDMEVINEVCPNAKIISKGKLVERIKEVKLVVIDDLSTSFIEALNINAPSVLYWDHEVYLIRPEAEHYFALLRNAGILFKEPLSAARKVNEVFRDPMEWWLSEPVQRARAEFCNRYAYAEKDWAGIWTKELRGI